MSSFGYFLARELVKEGIEVVAIDLDDEKIEKIKSYVSKAVIADGTDRNTLETLGVQEMDGVVVSLGQIESSVLTILHLKELKVRRILAKAISEEHGKILEMVGATEIVFPEKDMAYRVARTLTHDNILDHVPLAEGYSIIEISPPTSFLHKSLAELDLRRKYGVQVIVIKGYVPNSLVLVPTADYVIKDDDVLVIMGQDSHLKKVQGL
ncbi:TrkA family potassium uptake protein [bacterium]|nr:TrkA family potassium uptake protein [bacterium]